MTVLINILKNTITGLGNALWFLGEIFVHILKGRIRFGEVLKQMYEQGIQSVLIIVLTSLATGVVLALNGYVILVRFGAKEFIAPLVALSLVRELSPVFTALIFSGKAGARITAELGTMNVNDQILATRTMGVDPIDFLVVPRILACVPALLVLTIISEIVGIYGGYLIAVHEAHVPGPFYVNQAIDSIRYVDFFSGLLKSAFFAILIGWICCYQGFYTQGGSLGVGKYTTKAVAFAYIFIILCDTLLTKVILSVWG